MQQNPRFSFITSLLLLIIFVSASAAGASQQNDTAGQKPSQAAKKRGAAVAPFGTPIFTIYARIGPFTPEERARSIEKKLKVLAGDPFFRSDSIRLSEGETTWDVTYGETVITSVGDEDARAKGSSRELLAKANRAKIIFAIQQHRSATSKGEVMKTIAISGAMIILMIII
ncbi:MAG: hypothetical protein WCK34_17495, partial [Bacteroidota bacterium]